MTETTDAPAARLNTSQLIGRIWPLGETVPRSTTLIIEWRADFQRASPCPLRRMLRAQAAQGGMEDQ